MKWLAVCAMWIVAGAVTITAIIELGPQRDVACVWTCVVACIAAVIGTIYVSESYER